MIFGRAIGGGVLEFEKDTRNREFGDDARSEQTSTMTLPGRWYMVAGYPHVNTIPPRIIVLCRCSGKFHLDGPAIRLGVAKVSLKYADSDGASQIVFVKSKTARAKNTIDKREVCLII